MFFNQYPYINENDLNLDYILKHLKEFMARVNDLDKWRVNHEKEYEELKALYDRIISGDFPQSMIAELEKWLKNNVRDIVGEVIKMVFFAVTDDGYFVAYMPDNWNDIIFGTSGLDDFPSGVDFGHLTLTY